MTDNSLKKSPLHDAHVARNAKMADFGGWDMPIEFPGGGVKAEHTATREAVTSSRRSDAHSVRSNF